MSSHASDDDGPTLVKAASESDLTALAHADSLSLSPPAIPPLPIPDVPSPTLLSSPASPRSSPRASPHTPAASPTFPMPTIQATLSFSKYVASELAHDQQNAALGVTFAPADPATLAQPALPFAFPPDPDQSPPSSASPQPSQHLMQPTQEDSSDDKMVATFEEALSSSPRKTLPRLDLMSLDSRPESAFQTGHIARYGKLACIQIDEHGDREYRELTRTEILQEARATLSKSQPNPTAISQWLANSGGGVQSPSPELREFSHMFAGNGRKATRKALRDYLRNSLQARDIRQVDPAFAAKPALWVRHSALVVSLDGLRAIILHNKMFLFDPENEKTRNLAIIACQKIKATPDTEHVQPFEFKALEGILIFLAMGLELEFTSLKPDIESQLQQFPNELTTKMLEELRSKKQGLNNFQSKATSVKNILENLLDEDEEMANMYLTEKHTRNKGRRTMDHNEIETLLEAYLQVIDEHVSQSVLLNDAIDDTEDLVMIHLDTLRNRLLSVELALSVVSMTFAIGSVCAGLFGMNIQIPLFEATTRKSWFLIVVLGILATVIGVSWLVLFTLRQRGLYSFY